MTPKQDADESTGGKAYSLNDEDFQYETVGDVLDALECDGCLIEGEVFFEVDTKPVDLVEFMDADDILETASERAYDDLGECAEDAFDVGPDAAKELQSALDAWAAKHLSDRRYWRCVGKSRALKVTADDVATASARENGA